MVRKTTSKANGGKRNEVNVRGGVLTTGENGYEIASSVPPLSPLLMS